VATPPTFRSSADVNWNVTGTPKDTAQLNVTAGDVLVAFGLTEGDSASLITVSGGGLTWSLKKSITAGSYTQLRLYTATASATTAVSARFAFAGGLYWGGQLQVWGDTLGVGTASARNATTAAPTMNFTPLSANSAITVVVGDWIAATGATTWRANAGAFTETVNNVLADTYGAHGGYHADAGATATYALGLTAPQMKYAIGAVEIFGTTATASGGAVVPNNLAALGVG
jgi:hypothetical protein